MLGLSARKQLCQLAIVQALRSFELRRYHAIRQRSLPLMKFNIKLDSTELLDFVYKLPVSTNHNSNFNLVEPPKHRGNSAEYQMYQTNQSAEPHFFLPNFSYLSKAL